jgi:hypothetical protein
MKLECEIKRYSENNGYPISTYEAISCSCGEKQFHLYSDDEEGGAYVVCASCGIDWEIESSRKYIEQPLNNICNCDNDRLNIGIGKAYYAASNEPRWIYIGAHCKRCGLSGAYVDWKES